MYPWDAFYLDNGIFHVNEMGVEVFELLTCHEVGDAGLREVGVAVGWEFYIYEIAILCDFDGLSLYDDDEMEFTFGQSLDISDEVDGFWVFFELFDVDFFDDLFNVLLIGTIDIASLVM